MNTKTQKKLKHQRGFPCTHCSNWKYNRAYCLMRATFRKMRCPNLSIFCRFKLLYIFGRSLLMFSEVRLNQRVFSNVVALSPSSGLWMLHTHGSFCVPQRLWLPSHEKFMHAIDKEIHYIIGGTSGCFTMFYYQASCWLPSHSPRNSSSCGFTPLHFACMRNNPAGGLRKRWTPTLHHGLNGNISLRVKSGEIGWHHKGVRQFSFSEDVVQVLCNFDADLQKRDVFGAMPVAGLGNLRQMSLSNLMAFKNWNDSFGHRSFLSQHHGFLLPVASRIFNHSG